MKDVDVMDACVPISVFKAHCTRYLRKLECTGEPLEITRHGRVVARVAPPSEDERVPIAEWMGSCQGMMAEGAVDLFEAPALSEEDA